MIYIGTVHWKDPRWIEIQHRMIRQHVSAPYEVIGFLNGVDREYYRLFDGVLDSSDPMHEDKLDMLAKEMINRSKSDDDWMIFMDGDAFPIRDIVAPLAGMLKEHPLVAIQRLENLRELHPHPSFCVTTVGFWKSIGGTWQRGYQWKNQIGTKVTDVGGNLLGLLRDRNIHWKPLHRSNTVNYHPLLFGVYADLVYHQGAGFRFHGNSIDYYRFGHYGLWYRIQAAILERVIPKPWRPKFRLTMFHPLGRIYRKVRRQNDALYEEVYQNILSDTSYIDHLIEPGASIDNRYDGWEALAQNQQQAG